MSGNADSENAKNSFVSRLSVGMKVALPSLLNLGLLLFIALLSIWSMLSLGGIVSDLYKVRFQKLQEAAQIAREVTAVHAGVYTAIAWTAAEFDSKKISTLSKAQTKNLAQLIEKVDAAMKQPFLSEKEIAQFADLQKALTSYRSAAVEALDMLDQGLSYATMYFAKADSAYAELDIALNALVATQQEMVKNQYGRADSTASTSSYILIFIVILSVVASIKLMLYSKDKLVTSAAAIRDAAQNLQSGDLRVRVKVHSTDEIGQAANAFNILNDKFHNLISNLHGSVDSTTTAAERLNDAATEVANDAHKQSDVANQTAAAVEQMSISVGEIANHTRHAATASSQAGEGCEKTSAMMGEVVNRISFLYDTVAKATEVIHNLEHKSAEINGIAKVIKEIANHTKLLALNAEIEAHIAGVHGRGFSIVAEEVKRLAESTSDAVQKIVDVLDNVKTEANHAAQMMDAGAVTANESMKTVKDAAEAMNVIRQQTAQVISLTKEIANSVNEQEKTSSEISSAVERISKMADAHTDSSQKTKNEAEQLTNLSNDLKQAIGAFTV